MFKLMNHGELWRESWTFGCDLLALQVLGSAGASHASSRRHKSGTFGLFGIFTDHCSGIEGSNRTKQAPNMLSVSLTAHPRRGVCAGSFLAAGGLGGKPSEAQKSASK